MEVNTSLVGQQQASVKVQVRKHGLQWFSGMIQPDHVLTADTTC